MPPDPSLTTSEERDRALARRLRHEIGDFLQKVYATVAILQSRLPADSVKDSELLEGLQRRAQECKVLIDNLQDYLCPAPPKLESVDLALLTSAWLQNQRIKHPSIDWVIDCPEPVLIIADPEHLRQAAKQIIDNALQAGATRVTVRCQKSAGSVLWEFADNGPGLDPSIVADCLLPFRTTWSGHAGVGLALAQRTALAHRGKIVVENQSAGGCLTRIMLPLA